MGKNLPAMRKTQVQSLGQEDALEKGMATHSERLNFHFTSQIIARILCLPMIQSLNSEQLAGGAETSPALLASQHCSEWLCSYPTHRQGAKGCESDFHFLSNVMHACMFSHFSHV